MVFYGNGNVADAGIDAIQNIAAIGNNGLFWLRGGFFDWEDRDYRCVIE